MVNDGYLWWFILVGAVIALLVVFVFAVRLPREEADVSDDERRAEAAWISGTIERFGGAAPPELVHEVLELHAAYLASPELARLPASAVEGPTEGQDARYAHPPHRPGSAPPGPMPPGPAPPGPMPPGPMPPGPMPPGRMPPRRPGAAGAVSPVDRPGPVPPPEPAPPPPEPAPGPPSRPR